MRRARSFTKLAAWNAPQVANANAPKPLPRRPALEDVAKAVSGSKSSTRHLSPPHSVIIKRDQTFGNLWAATACGPLCPLYLRGRGHEVLFLVAPRMNTARRPEPWPRPGGKPVAEYCAEMHEVAGPHSPTGSAVIRSLFGRSSSTHNKVLTSISPQPVDQGLNRKVDSADLIPKRRAFPARTAMSKATCPNCGF